MNMLLAARARPLLALALLGAASLLASCGRSDDRPGLETIRIGGREWRLEVAADDATRSRGLGGREELPPDGGMIFIFPDAAPRAFWMAECLIPIDLIFLDRFGTILALHEMPTEPPRGEGESESAYHARLPMYASRRPAQFAIELPPGSIRSIGLSVNSRIPLEADRLKRHLR
jgi:uncharacterized membrane protein (UPF0127 family)